MTYDGKSVLGFLMKVDVRTLFALLADYMDKLVNYIPPDLGSDVATENSCYPTPTP